MDTNELEKKYLGKKISVPYHRKIGGYESERVVGVCEFIGINPHIPEWGLQVTIGRMPVTNVDPDTIELIIENQ